MKNAIATLTIAALAAIVTAPAYAGGTTVQVPEPVSMSLLAGGIVAIAAVKHLRRK
jgi:hypothetical protein